MTNAKSDWLDRMDAQIEREVRRMKRLDRQCVVPRTPPGQRQELDPLALLAAGALCFLAFGALVLVWAWLIE